MQTKLQVENLTVAIQQADSTKVVLNNINFSLKSGQIHALVGDSGSGKSITAQAIMRLGPDNMYYSSTSKILLEQEDVLNLPETVLSSLRGKKLALIFQESMSALNPVMQIGRQIEEIILLHEKISRQAVKQQARQLLTEVGLSADYYHSYPHQLSGGMRQRVVIAIAIALRPEVLIADEPTTALDSITQLQIIRVLQQLIRQHQLAVLFISHDLNLVSHIADEISLIVKGKIIRQMSQPDFIQHQVASDDLAALVKREERQELLPIMVIENASIHYQQNALLPPAVADINLQFYPGECVAVIGGSGSGKSTLAKALVKLLALSKGHIFYRQKDIRNIPKKEFSRQVQMIFQDPFASLNPKLTIREILREPLANHFKLNNTQQQKKMLEALQEVQLSAEMLERYPHEFSGGQRQRIAIARALLVQPKLLICDEPTSSLDASIQKQILGLLKKLQEKYQLTLLLITHNFSIVSEYADRVAVMEKGRIIEMDIAEKVLSHPQKEYTKALLEAAVF